MPRPKFPRAKPGTGRVEHDARGNAIWVRTRAEDASELPQVAGLALADDDNPGHVVGKHLTPKRTAPVAAKPVAKKKRS